MNHDLVLPYCDWAFDASTVDNTVGDVLPKRTSIMAHKHVTEMCLPTPLGMSLLADQIVPCRD